MTIAARHLRELMDGLRAADVWEHYKHELVSLREKHATARLLAHRYRGRKRDDSILNALGFKRRGGKKRTRLSKEQEDEIIETYTMLLVAQRPMRADAERLWASGFNRRALIDAHSSIPFRPRGGVGSLVISADGPLQPREAVAAMVKFFPELFATRDAVIARLERLRTKRKKTFELPSRKRHPSRR